jgi:ferredoxin
MQVSFAKQDLQLLLDGLATRGFEVIGPRLGEGAIVYDKLTSIEDLPRGWVEEQEAGTYRLQRDPENRYFAFTIGPQSWKKYLHPPNLCLFRTKKEGKSFSIDDSDTVVKRAFLGMRACELAAISVQDNVFLGQEYRDPWYGRRREATFFIGMNCSRAGGTCFCVSMNTGPQVQDGDDLTLTELRDTFLAEARTPAGIDLLKDVPSHPPSEAELSEASAQNRATCSQMGRTLDTDGLPDLLKQNLNHPRWDQVAERCLTCANCTMVCPTCFCFTVEDVTDLKGLESERVRTWDSCFTTEFTMTSGSAHRGTPVSRYRQWMTHKLSTWHDQFDESGCVGCGRCITWCPVGIDITEEAAAIRADEGA